MPEDLIQLRILKACFLAMTLFADSHKLVGQEPLTVRGEWVATAGSLQSLRGRWIGQALASDLDVIHGSWALTSEAGKTLLTGTWSARKTGLGWQGTWSARDRFRRTLSGTWKADEPGTRGKSLQQLLEQTLEKQMSGSWRRRGLQGHWWLKGSPQPARSK